MRRLARSGPTVARVHERRERLQRVARVVAEIRRSIIDRDVRVARGARIGAGEGTSATPEEITLVGMAAEIAEASSVPPGARVPPA